MLAGKVVEEFEVGGERAEIRYPKMVDADKYRKLINSLVEEGAKIKRQEKLDFEESVDKIGKYLKGIEKDKSVCLVAEYNDEIIAWGGIKKREGAESSQGHIGIMVRKDLRRKGVGTKVLENLLSEAKKRLDIRIAILGFFEDNEAAKSLYNKLDFVEVGEVEEGLEKDGKPHDEIIMYKDLE